MKSLKDKELDCPKCGQVNQANRERCVSCNLKFDEFKKRYNLRNMHKNH